MARGECSCWKTIVCIQKVCHPDLKRLGRSSRTTQAADFKVRINAFKNIAEIKNAAFGQASWISFLLQTNYMYAKSKSPQD